jgi:hypothetical protein
MRNMKTFASSERNRRRNLNVFGSVEKTLLKDLSSLKRKSMTTLTRLKTLPRKLLPQKNRKLIKNLRNKDLMKRQLRFVPRSKNKRKFSKKNNRESSELRMRLVMRNFTWNSKLVTMKKKMEKARFEEEQKAGNKLKD